MNNENRNLLRNNLHTLRALGRRVAGLTEAEQSNRLDVLVNMLIADQDDAGAAIDRLTTRWKVRDYQRDGKVYVGLSGIDSSGERYMMVYALLADVGAVTRFRDHHLSTCDGRSAVYVITPAQADEFYAATQLDEEGVLA